MKKYRFAKGNIIEVYGYERVNMMKDFYTTTKSPRSVKRNIITQIAKELGLPYSAIQIYWQDIEIVA